MLKKTLAILLLPLVLAGCKNSHQIETAAVIETVTVERCDGCLCYTFYPLGSTEKPEAVKIPADSFEEARSLAQRAYIPNVTLAKLRLLLIREDVVPEILRADIEYISTQASFSPVAYVALCDSGALRQVAASAKVQETMEQRILLCRQQHPEVCVDYLSVFNSYARGADGFSLAAVSGEDDLRVSARKIQNF